MKLSEIEARRERLAAEYLALPNAWCARGLEIAEEFGRLAEEEDHLRRNSYANQERPKN
jgi:hypothetical protein